MLETFGEGVRIVDDFAFEESVEFVGIDAVGAFHFAVQSWSSGADIDVSNAHVEQVPMKRRAEFLAVVRLNFLDLERQLRGDAIDKLNRYLQVVARVSRKTRNRVQSSIAVYW